MWQSCSQGNSFNPYFEIMAIYNSQDHPSLDIKGNTWVSNSCWIWGQKIPFFKKFCDMQIFLLNKWKDLILRTFILLGKNCWPRGQERFCVLCLFFLLAHLHQDRRIQKSSSSKRATHGLLPHVFPQSMGQLR